MQSFVSRHRHQIQGTLSGFDRLRFVGSLLRLSYVDGLAAFLGATGVLLKDFGDFMLKLSQRIKQAGEQLALGTPSGRVHYLPSGSRSKEDFVRGLPAPTRPGPTGLIAVLSCVEPCKTYEIHRNPRTKHLEFQPALRKCLHYYFYLDHPTFGPMHLRLQTWIPFQVKIVLNGRDWLARQLDITSAGKLLTKSMMTLHIRPPEKCLMAISLPDARELSDDILEALRLRALRGCELGFTETEVADLLGVSRETICRWWTAYAAGGRDAVPGDRTGRPVGSGRTLSDDPARHIQRRIDDHNPEDLGIPAALWTRKAVRDLIRKACGIDLPVRTVGASLLRWGSTAKVPRRHAQDQDPQEVRQWLEETYPAIERRAAAEDAEIPGCDETGAAADQPPHRGYARQGEPARMEVPDPHIRRNQIATISNEGAVHFLTYKETMTAARFLTFLERLLGETSRKVFLIIDRLRAHEAQAVEDWVAEHRDRIEWFFLPRYAPELNAEEYLNNDLKGSINASGLPGNKDELRSRMERFMSQLLHLPEHVRNYFQHPCVQYAASV